MRFCLVSTHTDQTIGYSKVATNILKQLSSRSEKYPEEKVKIFHFGFQRHVARASLRKVPNGVVSYDASANEDPKEEGFGYNKFKEYVDMVMPDVLMIYNDILTISKFLDALFVDPTKAKDPNANANPNLYDMSLKPNCKIWLYLDVMYHGMHPALLRKVFQVTDRIYVFSNTGKTQMELYTEKDLYGQVPQVRVLEHSVDTSVFFPINSKDSKVISRQKLGIPSDAIIFLNCNRNSGRKRLDHSVMAFARLLEKTKDQDAKFYFIFATGGVSGKTQSYYDIGRMFLEELKKFSLLDEKWKKRLILIDTNINLISDEGMNELYNICDIGVNTSTGEGFGLCTFEHMYASARGAAQIVTDTGCYSEYLGGQGDKEDEIAVIVKKSGHGYFDVSQSAFGFEYPLFDLNDIVKAFETCIADLDKWKTRSLKIQEKIKTWEASTLILWEDIVREKKI